MDPNNVKTEMYLIEEHRWKIAEDYPFDGDDTRVCEYAILYHNGAFYLFGGSTHSIAHFNTIARFDTKTYTWSKVGYS